MLSQAVSMAIVVLAALLPKSGAWASGMEPCSTFVDEGGRVFNVASAYAAADLVAVGKVSSAEGLTLKIGTRVKGNEKQKIISLAGPHCAGTACSGGFSVAAGIDLLFLLKRLPNGRYDGVAGNGNFSCPVVFEVREGVAVIGEKNIRVNSLKKYFESKPAPIAL